MIEIGKEYVFYYLIEAFNNSDDDIKLCDDNDGLSCKVIADKGNSAYGHCYEIETSTGSQFLAFESELTEIVSKPKGE